MRPLLVALVLLAPVALAQEGARIERDGWTQLVPDWQLGPADIVWRGRDVQVPDAIAYATDGESWLYGSTESPEALAGEHDCIFGENATAVVLSVERCNVAFHPSIACFGTDLCDAGIGQARPSGPPPTHGRVVERDGWTQFIPAWRVGPATFEYQGRTWQAPPGITYATDGATWLYGTQEAPEHVQEPPAACVPPPGANVTAVLVAAATCKLVVHPSVSCSGTDICLLERSPTSVTPPLTYPDSCSDIPGARCTPAAPVVGLLAAIAVGAALSAPWRGRGRA